MNVWPPFVSIRLVNILYNNPIPRYTLTSMRARRLFTHGGKRPQQSPYPVWDRKLSPLRQSFTPFDKNPIRQNFLSGKMIERTWRKQEDEKRKVTQQTGQRVAKVRGCPSRSFALPKIALAFLATASLSLAFPPLSRHAPFCAGDGRRSAECDGCTWTKDAEDRRVFQTGVGIGIFDGFYQ